MENSASQDSLEFEKNYDKSTFLSQPNLTKYEKTKIISERSQQLANGAISFLKNPERFNNVYEIALEELKQKKLPYIIRRNVSNKYEYWKLSDLNNY